MERRTRRACSQQQPTLKTLLALLPQPLAGRFSDIFAGKKGLVLASGLAFKNSTMPYTNVRGLKPALANPFLEALVMKQHCHLQVQLSPILPKGPFSLPPLTTSLLRLSLSLHTSSHAAHLTAASLVLCICTFARLDDLPRAVWQKPMRHCCRIDSPTRSPFKRCLLRATHMHCSRYSVRCDSRSCCHTFIILSRSCCHSSHRHDFLIRPYPGEADEACTY